MRHEMEDAAGAALGGDPEPFEATPTTFKRVMAALALCFLAIGLGIAAVVGVWG